jgi:DNA anti-recombination protein RmuC
VVDTPATHWTHVSDSTPPMAAAQQGVQELAVSLEVSRAKLDKENRQLKKANMGLKTANQNLTKKLAETEASQKEETKELWDRLQKYEELFSTHVETIQNHGEQLQQMAQQASDNRTEDQLKDQAATLHAQGVLLIQLAQQIQDLRQMQDAPPKEEGDSIEIVKV